MAVLDPVVLGLGAVRIAGQPAGLAELGKGVAAPGDQLVHVGLVAGVPQQHVPGGVEGPVQGQGELHHAQVGAQVAAGGGHRVDDELPDLRGQDGQLLGGEGAEVGGAVDVFEDHGRVGFLSDEATSAPPRGLLDQEARGSVSDLPDDRSSGDRRGSVPSAGASTASPDPSRLEGYPRGCRGLARIGCGAASIGSGEGAARPGRRPEQGTEETPCKLRSRARPCRCWRWSSSRGSRSSRPTGSFRGCRPTCSSPRPPPPVARRGS